MSSLIAQRNAEKKNTRQYCTFMVDDLYFGIEVAKVQEVLRRQPMTVVPLASNAIEGLINLRGQIVIAIDTRRGLGLPGISNDQRMNIVIRTEDTTVSLLVDEIGDVVTVSSERRSAVPDNMPTECRDLIESVYGLEDRLMLVLDTEKLLQHCCN